MQALGWTAVGRSAIERAEDEMERLREEKESNAAYEALQGQLGASQINLLSAAHLAFQVGGFFQK
jgi:hypothetical protein